MARLKDAGLRAGPGAARDLRRPVPRVRPPPRLLRPRREQRHEDAPRAARERERPRRGLMRLERSAASSSSLHARAAPQRPGRLDRRQHQRPRPGDRARRDQAVRRPYEDLTRGRRWSSSTSTGTSSRATHKPSSDTCSHLYIYRNRPDVNGVVHTHSRYATAFAAVGPPDPRLPHRPGRRVRWRDPVRRLRAHRRRRDRPARGRGHRQRRRRSCSRTTACSRSGPSAEAAVKAAVMAEDVAATVWAALQIGTPDESSPTTSSTRLHDRYTTEYGQ